MNNERAILAALARLGAYVGDWDSEKSICLSISDTDECCRLARRLDRLDDVFSSSSKLSDRGLGHLVGHPSLRTIRLRPGSFTASGLSVLPTLPSLQELHLQLDDEGDAGLNHVARCKGLTKLEYKSRSVSDAGVAVLIDLAELQDLDLTGTPIEEGAAIASGLPQLRNLLLDGTSTNDEALAAIGTARSLELLRLDRTPVTAEGVRQLANLKPLRSLSLNGVDLPATGLWWIERLPGLRWLAIERVMLDDYLVDVLGRMSQLSHLDLSWEGATDRQKTRLQQRLPDCDIVWWYDFQPMAWPVETSE